MDLPANLPEGGLDLSFAAVPAIFISMEHKETICGGTRVEDVQAAITAGAHAIGLNFVKSSPRFVDTEVARSLVRSSKSPELQVERRFRERHAGRNCSRLVAVLGLSIVQLHGDENQEFLARIRAALTPSVSIWKALRVASKEDLAGMKELEPDGWLIDSKVSGMHGGSGKTFDWGLLSDIPRSKPLVLSGGLRSENVADAEVRTISPDWVDVASGVESAPGIKDEVLIQRFVSAARPS